MNVNSKNLIQLQSICKNFNATICSVSVDFRFCDFNSQDFYLFPVPLPFLPKDEILIG